MFFDMIEALKKVLDVIIENPSQFTFILAMAVCVIALCSYLIHRRYKKIIADLATTVVALYDSESTAIELLKEHNASIKTKNILRSLAFQKGGYSTKKYRSQAMKYAKKD